MAENEETPPQEVNVTELLGRSMLDLPSMDDFHAFTSEIRSIGQSMNALSTSLDKSVEAQKALAEIYEKGMSKQASVVSSDASRPPPGPSASASSASTPTQGEDATTAATSGAEASSRAELTRMSLPDRIISRIRSAAPSPIGPNNGLDDDGPSGPTAGASGGGGASPGASKPETPREYLQAQMPTEGWHQLHYGEWKAQDFLERGGGLVGKIAQSQNKKWDKRVQDEVEANDVTPEEAAASLGGPPKSARYTTTAANALFAGGAWMPAVDMAQTVAGKFGYNVSPRALAATGEQAGAVPGESSTDIGPLRLPTGGFAAGVHQAYDQFKETAFAPGYNKRQSDFVYGQLQELGFRGQSGFTGQRFKNMRLAGKEIMQHSKEVGEDPATYQLMDKATRWGAESLNHFVAKMKELPDAATKAGVGVNQLMADMDAAGEAAQQQGGTHAQGQRFAQDIASAGLPPGPFVEAMGNPLVSGAAFRRTGLPPWEQGLMRPSERMGSLFSAVNQTYNAIGPRDPLSRKATGLAGELGGTFTNTGKEQRIAQLHQQFPELSPEILSQLVKPGTERSIQSGMQATDLSRQWRHQIRKNLPNWDREGKSIAQGMKEAQEKGDTPLGDDTIMKPNGEIVKIHPKTGHQAARGNMDEVESLFNPQTTKGGKFTWGDQISTLKNAKTINPNTGKLAPVMNKGDWKKLALAGMTDWDAKVAKSLSFDKKGWEKLAREGGPDVEKMRKGGISHKEQKVLRDAANKRQKTVEDIMHDKNKAANEGPKVTIELGPAAKKAFHINVGRAHAADKARQGGSSVVTSLGDPSLGFPPISNPSGGLPTQGSP